MKNFKVLFLLVTLITTMSFGEAIKEGPLYLNHKHYNSTYDKFLEDTIQALLLSEEPKLIMLFMTLMKSPITSKKDFRLTLNKAV